MAAATALAQSFEVASIRPNLTGESGGAYGNSHPGEVDIRNYPLQSIIEEAFDVRSFSFSGPAWLNSARFDITAKVPAGATLHERNLMMQALLKERFGLAVHHETKTLQGYELVQAKSGFRLQALGNDGKGDGGWDYGPGRVTAMRASISSFADRLARQLNAPVNDKTGIEGFYNFTLRYTEAGGDDTRPTIFTALQEQLGLRLEARKVPVDVVVVDHLERTPTEN
ncbi:MAG TPA: TIGR03435 family protein [Bryobacteraceae bacterium]|jgi:uncharacterized protein (TIGR03435 family)|nr:TIGR03435 family protein [Bryobacteraceae bacterium]